MLVRVCAVAALLLFSLGACSVRFYATSESVATATTPSVVAAANPVHAAWLSKVCGIRLAALERARELRAEMDPKAPPEAQRLQGVRFFREQGKVNESAGKALVALPQPGPPGAERYREMAIARVRDAAEDMAAAATYLEGAMARTDEELATLKQESNRLAGRREAEHEQRAQALDAAVPPEFARAYQAVPECRKLAK